MFEEVSVRSRKDIVAQRYGLQPVHPRFLKLPLETKEKLGITSAGVPNYGAHYRALINKSRTRSAAANVLGMNKSRLFRSFSNADAEVSAITTAAGRDKLAAVDFKAPVDINTLIDQPVHVGIGIDRRMPKREYKLRAGNYRAFRKQELEKIRTARPVLPTTIREALIEGILDRFKKQKYTPIPLSTGEVPFSFASPEERRAAAKAVSFKKGDIVEVRWHSGPIHVLVEKKYRSIKNGIPGFDGTVVKSTKTWPEEFKKKSDREKWFYSDQVIRVVRK